MPRNQFERMVFAFITVVITVHAYVFYSVYVVNGDALRTIAGTTSVLSAVREIGGIYMFDRVMPVWAVVLVEFCFAYTMECVYGSPISFKLACKNFDPHTALVQWLRLMCYNIPFAFFTQLFFIQPFVRTVFKLIFVRGKAKN